MKLKIILTLVKLYHGIKLDKRSAQFMFCISNFASHSTWIVSYSKTKS